MIEIKGLVKGYEKNKPVLKGVNVTVSEGSVFGLVGINGAGKSTLLRVLAGVMKADAGQVLIDGEEVYENERAKGKLFFLPDDPFYTSNVTAEGLAEMYRSVYDLDAQVFQTRLAQFALPANKPIRNFSKGMKRQVFVALALAIAPKYLLLDEAFDGLDPLARLTFKKCIVELVEEKGTSVIISSHSLRELEDICDHIGLLHKGGILFESEIDSLKENIHTIQAVFSKEIKADEIAKIGTVSIKQRGSMVTAVVRGSENEVREKVEALGPDFYEIIPLLLSVGTELCYNFTKERIVQTIRQT
jgi:ABC-2 type transport system ATP-binding protein